MVPCECIKKKVGERVILILGLCNCFIYVLQSFYVVLARSV